jgi:hypothetical protein
MDEEVGRLAPHGGVDRHAAPRLVDPPALTDRIARPHEAHVAPLERARAKAPDEGLAHAVGIGDVAEANAVEHGLARRQIAHEGLGAEIRLGRCIHRRPAPDGGKALGGRPFDLHAGGPSARAQITPEPVETSPDCTPCVMIGREAARESAGNAREARAAPEVASRERRETRERYMVGASRGSMVPVRGTKGKSTSARHHRDRGRQRDDRLAAVRSAT